VTITGNSSTRDTARARWRPARRVSQIVAAIGLSWAKATVRANNGENAMCYRDGRISGSGLDRGVGGALARAAGTGFVRAAQTLASAGCFAGCGDLVPYAEIDALLAADRRGRQAAASLAP